MTPHHVIEGALVSRDRLARTLAKAKLCARVMGVLCILCLAASLFAFWLCIDLFSSEQSRAVGGLMGFYANWGLLIAGFLCLVSWLAARELERLRPDLRDVASTAPADDLASSSEAAWQTSTYKGGTAPGPDLPIGVSSRWREHAYPLRQLTVRIQGTRHHDNELLATQLATVADRLRAGDIVGHHHDDDCGYAFELAESPEGPSFFDEACGRR
jgi:hypothetical protein